MLCTLGQQQQKETKENKKTKMAKASPIRVGFIRDSQREPMLRAEEAPASATPIWGPKAA